MANDIPYGEKMLEARLSQIGADVVRATEQIFTAKKLCDDSYHLLMDVQTNIADLYESLGVMLKQK